ncbi:hypothetical protein LN149_003407 [Providencia stuartii]|nr:hypothetical protein [Providencia stuartii]
MSPKNKMLTIEIFMTKKDEQEFSLKLRESFPDIYFIDFHPWDSPFPPMKNSIALCYDKLNSIVVISDESIVSQAEYIENDVKPFPTGSGYMGNPIGRGLIQYQHSKEAGYAKGCIMNGRLTASYFPENDPETDVFVKTVWKIFKKGAQKVYLIDRKTGELSAKPETRFFAWPDAAKTYDGTDGRYLTNHAFAYFVAKP